MDLMELPNEKFTERICNQPQRPQGLQFKTDLEIIDLWKIYRDAESTGNYYHSQYLNVKSEMIRRCLPITLHLRGNAQ